MSHNTYTIKNASTDSSLYAYWPVEELSIAYAEAPAEVAISPIRAIEITAGSNVSAPLTIENVGNTTRAVTVSFSPPSGWTVSPDSANYTIAPGGSQTFRFSVGAPESAVPGYYSGRVRISADSSLVIKGYQFVVVPRADMLTIIVPILVVLAVAGIAAYAFYAKNPNIFKWRKR